eukprot:g5382.t1
MQRHFDVRSELGQKVKDAMDEEGYIVLSGILNEEESDRVRGRMWEWVAGVQPAAISRTERNTWYPNARGGVDLWPHSGENYPSDKCCSFGAGWVLGELREILAERIFEHIFGTKELLSSREGFTFHRPTANGQHPKSGSERSLFSHQTFPSSSADMEGSWYLQSATSLVDEGVEDGHLVFWPKSHKQSARTSPGEEGAHVYLKKGDVVVWRSDLAHATAAPSSKAKDFCAVAYVSMLPISVVEDRRQSKHLTTEDALRRLMQGYLGLETTDHRVGEEIWLEPAPERATLPRGSFFSDGAPLVSIRQAELYGLIPYSATNQDLLEASSRGVRFSEGRFGLEADADADADADAVSSDDALSRPQLVTLTGAVLLGQDKFLGGVGSPCGKIIYGVPGTAKRVLEIDIAAGSCRLIGPEYPGRFKWLRGVPVPREALREEERAEFPLG